ncbi:Uncharacterised protein [Dermatophilus congolensis]|uniref:Uncharacterized protein n=1 Tax=Dermatophilus congolensis TaxID=1863 RepID=A0A239VDS5_9MICO|nr:Uncharacterised protein [Dermatophilus congolensis]
MGAAIGRRDGGCFPRRGGPCRGGRELWEVYVSELPTGVVFPGGGWGCGVGGGAVAAWLVVSWGGGVLGWERVGLVLCCLWWWLGGREGCRRYVRSCVVFVSVDFDRGAVV